MGKLLCLTAFSTSNPITCYILHRKFDIGIQLGLFVPFHLLNKAYFEKSSFFRNKSGSVLFLPFCCCFFLLQMVCCVTCIWPVVFVFDLLFFCFPGKLQLLLDPTPLAKVVSGSATARKSSSESYSRMQMIEGKNWWCERWLMQEEFSWYISVMTREAKWLMEEDLSQYLFGTANKK